MDHTNDIAQDARRYRAFCWMICATEEQQAGAAAVVQPLVEGSAEPTQAQLDMALDALADHIATLY